MKTEIENDLQREKQITTDGLNKSENLPPRSSFRNIALIEENNWEHPVFKRQNFFLACLLVSFHPRNFFFNPNPSFQILAIIRARNDEIVNCDIPYNDNSILGYQLTTHYRNRESQMSEMFLQFFVHFNLKSFLSKADISLFSLKYNKLFCLYQKRFNQSFRSIVLDKLLSRILFNPFC